MKSCFSHFGNGIITCVMISSNIMRNWEHGINSNSSNMENTNTGMVGSNILVYRTRHKRPGTLGPRASHWTVGSQPSGPFLDRARRSFFLMQSCGGALSPTGRVFFLYISQYRRKVRALSETANYSQLCRIKEHHVTRVAYFNTLTFEKIHSMPTNCAAKCNQNQTISYSKQSYWWADIQEISILRWSNLHIVARLCSKQL